MRFDLAVPSGAIKAFAELRKLQGNKCLVEVKKISPRRSLPQNAYLHLLIGAFGVHFGYTLEESKQIYKEINADIYKYEKKGRTFWRSSADLNKEEMARSIDAFMKKSAEAGYPLPLATDQGWLMEIENEIQRSKYYL